MKCVDIFAFIGIVTDEWSFQLKKAYKKSYSRGDWKNLQRGLPLAMNFPILDQHCRGFRNQMKLYVPERWINFKKTSLCCRYSWCYYYPCGSFTNYSIDLTLSLIQLIKRKNCTTQFVNRIICKRLNDYNIVFSVVCGKSLLWWCSTQHLKFLYYPIYLHK